MGEDRPLPKEGADVKTGGNAEKTKKVIQDLAETPPAKPIAELKAASEIIEANADKLEPDESKKGVP